MNPATLSREALVRIVREAQSAGGALPSAARIERIRYMALRDRIEDQAKAALDRHAALVKRYVRLVEGRSEEAGTCVVTTQPAAAQPQGRGKRHG